MFFVTNLFQRRQHETLLLEDSITPWMGPLAPWAREEVHAYNDDRARNWFIGAVIVILSGIIVNKELRPTCESYNGSMSERGTQARATL